MRKKKEKIQVIIGTLKAGEETIAKVLERRFRHDMMTMEGSKYGDICQERHRKDNKNYILICLLSNIYELFTKIIATWLDKKYMKIN